MNSPESEITLTLDRQRAVVSNYGASLRRYFHLDGNNLQRDLLWGYTGRAGKKGGQGDVLIPFPGRIRAGQYQFGEKAQQLDCNDKEGPNAIHGFVRTALWAVDEQRPEAVEFSFELNAKAFRGYPFSLHIRLRYELTAAGLECRTSIRNTGSGPAPVGAGFHPYFTVGTSSVDEAELCLPATEVVEFAPDLLPTGQIVKVADTALDFQQPRRIGPLRLNHCFTGLARDSDGLARVHLRSPASQKGLTVWMDQTFAYVVLYTGDALAKTDARQALAIEPMTCATDAFNHSGWGTRTLAPGQSFTARFGVGFAV